MVVHIFFLSIQYAFLYADWFYELSVFFLRELTCVCDMCRMSFCSTHFYQSQPYDKVTQLKYKHLHCTILLQRKNIFSCILKILEVQIKVNEVVFICRYMHLMVTIAKLCTFVFSFKRDAWNKRKCEMCEFLQLFKILLFVCKYLSFCTLSETCVSRWYRYTYAHVCMLTIADLWVDKTTFEFPIWAHERAFAFIKMSFKT